MDTANHALAAGGNPCAPALSPQVDDAQQHRFFKAVRAIPRQYCRSLALLTVGMALCHVWEEVYFIGDVVSSPTDGYDRHTVLFLFKMLAFFAVAATPGVFERISARRSFASTLAALFVLSSLSTALAFAFPGVGPVLLGCSGAIGGVAVGFTTLLWFKTAARIAPTLLLLAFTVWQILSALLAIPCFHLPPAISLATFAVAAPAGVIAIAKGLIAIPESQEEPVVGKAASNYRWLMAITAIYSLAWAFREPVLGNNLFDPGSYTAIGTMLFSAVIAVGIVVWGTNFNLAFIFKTVLPLTGIMFLMLPLNIPLFKGVSEICSVSTNCLIECLITFGVGTLCIRDHRAGLQVFGLAFGMEFLGIFAGRFLWNLFAVLFDDAVVSSTCSNLIAVALMSASILLLPGKRVFAEWGLSRAGHAAAQGADAQQAFEYRCHEFAERWALTKREEKIVSLWLQDKTYSEISDELCIGKETVKTHRRNIYYKCGVHSRGELQELFDSL